jgi:thiosulfate/3-mercaptopyruvate sulfurtransferase
MSRTALITVGELAAHLQDPDWRIIDCRFSLADTDAGYRAYAAGHIPGAIYADLDRDLSGPITESSGRHPLPEREQLRQRLGAWGIAAQTRVVVYDDAGGAFAARLWWLLRWMGHEAVGILDGGFPAWLAADRPVDSAEPHYARRDFPERPPLAQWLSAEQVLSGLASGDMLLVDARAAPRFEGTEEPLDPVAGHVPGALNRPYQDNLSDDGRFLPSPQLREQFQALIAAHPPAQVVHMCGSGVTACHNLFAMELAGLSGAGLYAGSWSEWIRDPARPVAGPGAKANVLS